MLVEWVVALEASELIEYVDQTLARPEDAELTDHMEVVLLRTVE